MFNGWCQWGSKAVVTVLWIVVSPREALFWKTKYWALYYISRALLFYLLLSMFKAQIAI